MIGTYDEASRDIKKILARHWSILTLDPDLRQAVGPNPSITYKRGQSLRHALVHSHMVPPPVTDCWLSRRPIGCYRCSGCVACPFIETGQSFTSSQTGRHYKIRSFLNCKSTHVVYRARCSCNLEYVGKTTRQFRRRVGEHLGDIRHRRDTAIARHVHSEHGGDPKCL